MRRQTPGVRACALEDDKVCCKMQTFDSICFLAHLKKTKIKIKHIDH